MSKVIKKARDPKEVSKKADIGKRYRCGSILKFKYDGKKPVGEIGGWKNDPRPYGIVVYDDKAKNRLHLLNMNYIPWTLYRRIINLVDENPKLKFNGRKFYKELKSHSPEAVKKSYRKYVRDVALKNAQQITLKNKNIPENIQEKNYNKMINETKIYILKQTIKEILCEIYVSM